jgi:transposase
MRDVATCSTLTSAPWTAQLFALTKQRRARGKKIGRKRLTPEESRSAQGLGVSRGGLSTKIHILTDGNGLPLSFTITPGQTHEATQVDALLQGVNVGGKRGPRRKRLRTVAGDKGYHGRDIARRIRERGIKPLIPQRRGPNGEYPEPERPFDTVLYRRRNVVERRNGHLKENRRIATRYEKLGVNFIAMIQLAFVLTFLKILLSDRA